jgi:hypothetical protein
LTQAAAFGVVKKVSHAMGSEDLKQTYRHVLASEMARPATDIIDLAIKLDHFTNMPETEVMALHKELIDNPFSYSLMRNLVADHLYLYKPDRKTMQRIGAKLDIKVSNPQILDNRQKLLK